MPHELSAEDRQTLRHVVLAALAIRHGNALTATQVRARVAMEVDFKPSVEEVTAALELLAGLTAPLAKKVNDKLGPGTYWQATSEGVMESERESSK